MDIIHIDPKSYELLVDWETENDLLVKSVAPYNRCYFDKVVLDFGKYPDEEVDKPLIAYFEKKNDYVKFSIKYDKKQITKGKFIATPEGENDYDIYYFASEETAQEMTRDDIEYIVQVIVTSYIAVNALLLYGNLVDGTSTTVRAKSDEDDKHYFIKEYDNKLYAVSSHTHRSPEGIFSVRGHFRKYKKSGKVIWIDEYLKGTEKD